MSSLPSWLSDPNIVRKFEVIRRLGAGGMGETVLVRHRELNVLRVLKSVLPHYAADAEYVRRFREEAIAATRVDDLHVAKLHDLSLCADGTPVAEWEYIDGRSARELLAFGPLPIDRALRLSIEMMQGLEVLHTVMIHRDIKPENLMILTVPSSVELKIIDFGLAKALNAPSITTSPIGTASYLPPECWEMREPDRGLPTVDIFAAGCVLYELLTGNAAFTGNALQVVSRMITGEPDWIGPLTPGLPQAATLTAIIRRAVARWPRDRYPTASDFHRDLENVLRGLDVAPAVSPSPAPSPVTAPRVLELPPEVAEVLGRVEELELEHPQLFGRDSDLAAVLQFVDDGTQPMGVMLAPAGSGKSALMAHVALQLRSRSDVILLRHFFSERYAVTSAAGDAYRSLLAQFSITTGDAIAAGVSDHDARMLLYERLSRFAADGRGRIVIVIDGLDEADRTFELPVVPMPGRHVITVVSMRGPNHELPPVMYPLRPHLTVIPFEPKLASKAVTSWLKAALPNGISEAAAFTIVSHTDGFPLYLRHLVEDLAAIASSGGRVEDAIRRTPQGFAEYVKYYASALTTSGSRWIVPALAALTVSSAALSVEQLSAILGETLTDFDMMNAARPVRLWITCSRRGGIQVYAISHPLLASEIATQVQTVVRQMETRFQQYCARWAEHRDEYALRYYVDHLIAADRFDEVAELVRDRAYADAQLTSSRSGDAIRDRFLMRVLEEARRRNVPTVIAECVAARLSSMPAPELVVDAIGKRDPHALLDLAGNTSVPTVKAILTLLALRESDRMADHDLVRRVMSELRTPTEAFVTNFTAMVLVSLRHEDSVQIASVAKRVLAGASMRRFVEARLERVPSDVAAIREHLFSRITEPMELSKVTAATAVAHARNADWEQAEAIARANDLYVQAWAFRDLCRIAVSQDDERRALRLCQHIVQIANTMDSTTLRRNDPRWPLAEAYGDLAVWIASKDRNRARFILDKLATPVFEPKSGTGDYARATAALGSAYVRIGIKKKGGDLLDRAWEHSLKSVKNGHSFDARRSLIYLSRLYLGCGELERAVDLAQEARHVRDEFPDAIIASETEYRAAVLLFRAGQVGKAVHAAKKIRSHPIQIVGLSALAQEFVDAGHGDEALALAPSSRDRRGRLSVLCAVAGHAAMVGDDRTWDQSIAEVAKELHATAEVDSRHRYTAAGYVAVGLSRKGLMDRANALVDLMAKQAESEKYSKLRTWGLIELASSFGETDPDRGRSLLTTAQKSLESKTGLSVEVAKVLARWDPIASSDIVRRVRAAVATVPVTSQPGLLCHLAEASAIVGDEVATEECMREATRVARTAKPAATMRRLLADAASGYVRLGMFDQAMALISEVPHEPKARSAAAEVTLRRNGATEALALAEIIRSPRIRLETLRSIATWCVTHGDRETAALIVRRVAAQEDQYGDIMIVSVIKEASTQQMNELLLDLCSVVGRWAGATLVMLGSLARAFPECAADTARLLELHLLPETFSSAESESADLVVS